LKVPPASHVLASPAADLFQARQILHHAEAVSQHEQRIERSAGEREHVGVSGVAVPAEGDTIRVIVKLDPDSNTLSFDNHDDTTFATISAAIPVYEFLEVIFDGTDWVPHGWSNGVTVI